MQTREISSNDWQSFFNQVSKALQGKLIKIEVDSLELGSQVEVDQLSLNGLTYDKKDDAFVISSDAIEHVFHSPQQIFATDGSDGINSLKVHSVDGTEQIINFVEALALPPAIQEGYKRCCIASPVCGQDNQPVPPARASARLGALILSPPSLHNYR